MPAASRGAHNNILQTTTISGTAVSEASLRNVALAVISFGGGVAETWTANHGPLVRAWDVSPRNGPSMIMLAWAGTWLINSCILATEDCSTTPIGRGATAPRMVVAVMASDIIDTLVSGSRHSRTLPAPNIAGRV